MMSTRELLISTSLMLGLSLTACTDDPVNEGQDAACEGTGSCDDVDATGGSDVAADTGSDEDVDAADPDATLEDAVDASDDGTSDATDADADAVGDTEPTPDGVDDVSGDASDAVDATDAVDAVDVLDAVDGVEEGDTPDFPDVMDATDVMDDATDVADTVDTVDVRICSGDTWDNGDACVPFTECTPGQRVSEPGSATSDRACSDCSAGSYSLVANASECNPWSPCVGIVLIEGSATRNRVCVEPDDCASNTDQASCITELSRCAWNGVACQQVECRLIGSMSDCLRQPSCQIPPGTGICAVDESEPIVCSDVVDETRCNAIGLGCTYNADSGTCEDAGVPVDCVVGEFGEWSECDRICGTGSRTRTQQVVTPASAGGICLPAEESEPCNTEACVCSSLTREQCDLADPCVVRDGRCIDPRLETTCSDLTSEEACNSSFLTCFWAFGQCNPGEAR